VNTREFLASMGAVALGLCSGPVPAQAPVRPFVRWADLDLDPALLDRFEAAADAHARAVMRVEPGVVAFHAVSELANPARVRVFEMYDDFDAYRAHLQQAHFREFVRATGTMLKDRRVHDTVPVRLGAKPRLSASPLVRIAELDIDPAQLQAYRAAVTEEIDDSIRLEPGVLTIYSVALSSAPSHLRFFEIYADEAAYRAHIASAHFRKYVEATQGMITSRKLFETRPIFLGLR
jgi:quinol monooxygenase YgiN